MIARRRFIAFAAASGTAAQTRRRLLIPTDKPDEHGFRIMWANPIAPPETTAWRLHIAGLVDSPGQFTIDDLRGLPQEQQSSRMKCVQCWSARAVWGGFRLESLLDIVKPRKNAKVIRVDCADKWYLHLALKEAASPRVMLALDMAGKPLSDQHGAPLRLIDPSKYGYLSAKLITSITFVEEGRGSMACDTGPYYSDSGAIQAGYDHPLDLGPDERRKIGGGEITDY